MAITVETKKFIDSLLKHYTDEAAAYRQIAENFSDTVKSVEDIAFGIITGCVYSGFLQSYQNQQESPGLDDINEFYQILNDKASNIRKAIGREQQPKEIEDSHDSKKPKPIRSK